MAKLLGGVGFFVSGLKLRLAGGDIVVADVRAVLRLALFFRPRAGALVLLEVLPDQSVIILSLYLGFGQDWERAVYNLSVALSCRDRALHT